LVSARLGIARWKASVEDKLETLDDIYRFAVEQVAISRGQFLELTVVLILILELVLFVIGVMRTTVIKISVSILHCRAAFVPRDQQEKGEGRREKNKLPSLFSFLIFYLLRHQCSVTVKDVDCDAGIVSGRYVSPQFRVPATPRVGHRRRPADLMRRRSQLCRTAYARIGTSRLGIRDR
jgi:hypothetical protein